MNRTKFSFTAPVCVSRTGRSLTNRKMSHEPEDDWLYQWIQIAEGSSVGNKRIQNVDSVTTNRVRLSITESSAQPQIKDFSVYKM